MKHKIYINIWMPCFLCIFIMVFSRCGSKHDEDVIIQPAGDKHGKLIGSNRYPSNYAFRRFLLNENRKEIYFINCSSAGCNYDQIYALNYERGRKYAIYTPPTSDALIQLIKYEKISKTLIFNRFVGEYPRPHLLDLQSMETTILETDPEAGTNDQLINDHVIIFMDQWLDSINSYAKIYKSDFSGNLELLDLVGVPIYLYKNRPEIVVRDSTEKIHHIFNYESDTIVHSVSIDVPINSISYQMVIDNQDFKWENLTPEFVNANFQYSHFDLSVNIQNSVKLDLNLEKGKIVIMKDVIKPLGGPLYKSGNSVSLIVRDLRSGEQKEVSKNSSDLYLQAKILSQMDSMIYQTNEGYYIVGIE